MAGVDAEHVLEVAAVDDQDPVEALAAEGADPTLGVRIRIRGSDGRPGNPHALAAEDLVEGAAELTVAIVKEKAEGLFPVGQVHQQVARLLCDPAPPRKSLTPWRSGTDQTLFARRRRGPDAVVQRARAGARRSPAP
jgi:hypothetical protein